MSETNNTIAIPEENGVLHIAEDVVASIAAVAASEVEGVAALTGAVQRLSRKNIAKGVKVTIEQSTAVFTLSLTLAYGYTVMSVSRKVQDAVKTAVESMTGLSVGAVNVYINDVAFHKGKPAKEKK